MPSRNIFNWSSSNFTASGSFVVPDRVTMIEVWGMGGGGGGGGGSEGGGGGGNGWGIARLNVTAGQTLNIVIGAGGTAGGGTNNGSNGGNSTVSGSGISTVTFRGSQGGQGTGQNKGDASIGRPYHGYKRLEIQNLTNSRHGDYSTFFNGGNAFDPIHAGGGGASDAGNGGSGVTGSNGSTGAGGGGNGGNGGSGRVVVYWFN